jgi:hypothetical protein
MVFEQHTAHEAESKEHRANALGLISCIVLAVEGPALPRGDGIKCSCICCYSSQYSLVKAQPLCTAHI